MSAPIRFDIEDIKIRTPTRMMCIGQSGTGKTEWLIKLIKSAKYQLVNPPDRIIYFYSILQPKIAKLAKETPHMELHEGFDANLYANHKPTSHLLICVDDLMNSDCYKELSNLFTRGRHLNISTIFLTQNAYFKGTSTAVKYNRDILVNATDLVYFRSLRDHVGAMTIGRQAFPHKYEFFKAVYEDVMKDPFSYLYMSFNAQARPELILRTKIFYNLGEIPIIYM